MVAVQKQVPARSPSATSCSGPVTGVDPARNQIEVIGQTVQLSPPTRAGGGDAEQLAVAAAFPLHSVVKVSGMRRGDGVVVASRVSPAEPRAPAQVMGPVTKLDSGIVWVAGTAVRTDNRASISIGDELQVIGRWDGGAIVAVQSNRFHVFRLRAASHGWTSKDSRARRLQSNCGLGPLLLSCRRRRLKQCRDCPLRMCASAFKPSCRLVTWSFSVSI